MRLTRQISAYVHGGSQGELVGTHTHTHPAALLHHLGKLLFEFVSIVQSIPDLFLLYIIAPFPFSFLLEHFALIPMHL